jgi:DNA polymerase-4
MTVRGAPRTSADTAEARTILHVDMDAFFVSVELLRRPELRGQPVVVGGTGNRGVVAAANYEARAFGVHSAMPSTRARRLCPHAVFLPGDHQHYGEISKRVMAIFTSFTPFVEPLSLDEAFLDVTGSRRLYGEGEAIGHAIRQRVLDDEGLTCSVGVAATKFIAKLASEAAKPRANPAGVRPGLGVKVVAAGDELRFLHPLPARALWGVGPVTLDRLERLGVRTVGDIAALPETSLVGALGKANGQHLHRLAHAIDDRDVVPEQGVKSIGHEETFATDHHRLDTLERELIRMADAVGSRLRAHDLAGRTVQIKVRFRDFQTITRSTTMPAPVDDTTTITRAAKTLLAAIDPAPGVRLLGVSVAQLSQPVGRQLSLDDLGARSREDATGAVDAIRERFGDDAIGPAVLAEPGGIRVKRRGDQQWGPDQR